MANRLGSAELFAVFEACPQVGRLGNICRAYYRSVALEDMIGSANQILAAQFLLLARQEKNNAEELEVGPDAHRHAAVLGAMGTAGRSRR